MNLRIAYLSYDGAVDPLGRSQVIPYLKGIAERGCKVDLITFEKKVSMDDITGFSIMKKTLQASGINWHPLLYHKKLSILATIYDLLRGIRKLRSILKSQPIDIVHARSYIAAMMALAVQPFNNFKFVFDMRGFWPDEKVDGRIMSKNSLLYRIVKSIEKKLFLKADAIVSLTNKGLDAIHNMSYMKGVDKHETVIPTCVDTSVFTPAPRERRRRELDIEDRFVAGYLGSLGTHYLFNEMIDLFLVIKRHITDSVFYIITHSDMRWVESKIKERGLNQEDYLVDKSVREDIPDNLSVFDVSIFFYAISFGRKGTCPTKMAESLACGVPFIANSGIGDVDDIINKYNVGVIVSETNNKEYEKAFMKILQLKKDNELSKRCRETAIKAFDLKFGVNRYIELYERLTL